MGLSLEGFGEEFEIGKFAFELEDLKKEEKKKGNSGIFLFGNKFRVRGRIGAARIGGLGRKGERCEQATKDFRGFLKRRHKGSGNGAIAIKAVEVCFSLLLEFLPMFDFSSCSFPNTQCIVDWCGRKGPQFVLLRFVACLFALF